ncbi:hypothetical protein [Methanolobus sp.]|uniref:tetratricopeptide repeat protein n=1 Tax=Methanolobus sp. TaxID=1874737 RepID=UPI0025CDCCDF|nr:hypothetical protein [Methanolobus sp.]
MSEVSTLAEWVEKSVFEPDPKKAIQYIDNALAFNSNNQEALYLKCMLLYKEKKYQKAYDVASKMIDLKYQNAEAWYARGLVSEKIDKKGLASKCYEKAIQFDPQHHDALHSFIELNNYPKSALKYYRLIIEIEPANIDIWIRLIDSVIEEEQYSDALNEITRARKYHFNNKELDKRERKLIVHSKSKVPPKPKKNKSVPLKKKPKEELRKKPEIVEVIPQKKEVLNNIEVGDFYNEWDSPAPVTIYCRMYNIPYSSYKYYQTRSSSEIKIKNIEDHLNARNLNCMCCSFCVGNICTYKKKHVVSSSICKHFSPKKGIQLKNIHLNTNKEKRFKCPYCNKKSQRDENIAEHMRIKHPHEFKNHYPNYNQSIF